MPDRHLHIVSFDIPYPPNYGGVIDVFYKIKALHSLGVKIHLHCFEYGREHSAELKAYCESVNYYKRKTGFKYMFGSLPYIVSTRNSEELINDLSKDDFPVLFEGLHSCLYLNDEKLKSKTRIVRTHNIEHDYYSALAKVEKRFFKKRYFNKESARLKSFEKNLLVANHIIAISPADAKQLSERYENASCITAFHPDEKINIKAGKGKFALYHGNMAVGENNEAALYLVKNIFNDIQVPLLIAGNNPSAELLSESKRHSNVQIKYDISTSEIQELVRDAQMNILPTFQATGIKLKLLSALFNGRHCIVNSPMVANTGMETLCSIKDSPEEMKEAVVSLFEKEFDLSEKNKREEILLEKFSNRENAKKLVQLIWNHG